MSIPTSANLSPSFSRRSLKDCRWVVFDAVGTLIEPVPRVAVAYHDVGTRLGSRLDLEEVGRRFRLAFRNSETDGFPNGPVAGSMVSSDAIEEARWRWIVGEVFTDVEDRERCFRELWDHFAAHSSWRCFEDVGQAIARLRTAGFQLAVASNFDRRLHPVCDSLPDLNPIELRLVSAEVGYRKPAPEFYAALIDRCACPPNQILMIGDSYEHDVQGPEAAGLRALHLERRQAQSQPNQLRSLFELVEHLV